MSENHTSEFETHYQQLHDRLLDRMTAIVSDRDAAEDITATALAKGFENLPRFRAECALSTWLYRIALNELWDGQRHRRFVSLDALDGFEPKRTSDPDEPDPLETSESYAQLHRALKRIPAMYRRTLVDHYIHGYPVKQIARRHGVPHGTVLSRLFSGKRHLRRVLNRSGWT